MSILDMLALNLYVFQGIEILVSSLFM